jgi:hypothetical protein
MCADIIDFYLNTPMECYKYMWVPADMLPEEAITAYELQGLIVNRRVLVEIQKGMYGLPQAGRIMKTNWLRTLYCMATSPAAKHMV